MQTTQCVFFKKRFKIFIIISPFHTIFHFYMLHRLLTFVAIITLIIVMTFSSSSFVTAQTDTNCPTATNCCPTGKLDLSSQTGVVFLDPSLNGYDNCDITIRDSTLTRIAFGTTSNQMDNVNITVKNIQCATQTTKNPDGICVAFESTSTNVGFIHVENIRVSVDSSNAPGSAFYRAVSFNRGFSGDPARGGVNVTIRDIFYDGVKIVNSLGNTEVNGVHMQYELENVRNFGISNLQITNVEFSATSGGYTNIVAVRTSSPIKSISKTDDSIRSSFSISDISVRTATLSSQNYIWVSAVSRENNNEEFNEFTIRNVEILDVTQATSRDRMEFIAVKLQSVTAPDLTSANNANAPACTFRLENIIHKNIVTTGPKNAVVKSVAVQNSILRYHLVSASNISTENVRATSQNEYVQIGGIEFSRPITGPTKNTNNNNNNINIINITNIHLTTMNINANGALSIVSVGFGASAEITSYNQLFFSDIFNTNVGTASSSASTVDVYGVFLQSSVTGVAETASTLSIEQIRIHKITTAAYNAGRIAGVVLSELTDLQTASVSSMTLDNTMRTSSRANAHTTVDGVRFDAKISNVQKLVVSEVNMEFTVSFYRTRVNGVHLSEQQDSTFTSLKISGCTSSVSAPDDQSDVSLVRIVSSSRTKATTLSSVTLENNNFQIRGLSSSDTFQAGALLQLSPASAYAQGTITGNFVFIDNTVMLFRFKTSTDAYSYHFVGMMYPNGLKVTNSKFTFYDSNRMSHAAPTTTPMSSSQIANALVFLQRPRDASYPTYLASSPFFFQCVYPPTTNREDHQQQQQQQQSTSPSTSWPVVGNKTNGIDLLQTLETRYGAKRTNGGLLGCATPTASLSRAPSRSSSYSEVVTSSVSQTGPTPNSTLSRQLTTPVPSLTAALTDSESQNPSASRSIGSETASSSRLVTRNTVSRESATETSSKLETFSNQPTASQTVPLSQKQTPALLQAAVDIVIPAAVFVQLLSASPAAAANAMAAARARPVMGAVTSILKKKDSCKVTRESLNENFSPPDIFSSPLQIDVFMSDPPERKENEFTNRSGIGYCIGGILGLVVVCIVFALFYGWISIQMKKMSSSTKRRSEEDEDEVEDEEEEDSRRSKKHNNSKNSKFKQLLEKFVENEFYDGFFFALSVLIAPMILFTILIMQVPETPLPWLIICPTLVFGGFVLMYFGVFAGFGLVVRRRSIERFDTSSDDDDEEEEEDDGENAQEKFVAANNSNDGKPKKGYCRRLIEKLVCPEGDWKVKVKYAEMINMSAEEREMRKKRVINPTSGEIDNEAWKDFKCKELTAKKRVFQFKLAKPFLDPYTHRFKNFFFCDLGSFIGLAAAELIGSKTENCELKGILMCVVLGIHGVLLCCLFRPYQEVFMRIIVPVVSIMQIVLLVLAILGSGKEEEDDASSEATLARVALVNSLLMLLCALLSVVAFLLPKYDQLVESCCGSPNSGDGGQKNINKNEMFSLSHLRKGKANNNSSDEKERKKKKKKARLRETDEYQEMEEMLLSSPSRSLAVKHLHRESNSPSSRSLRPKHRSTDDTKSRSHSKKGRKMQGGSPSSSPIVRDFPAV